MWISKFDISVKTENGDYRKVKKGENIPEAAMFQRPYIWADWVGEEVPVEEEKQENVAVKINKSKKGKKKKR